MRTPTKFVQNLTDEQKSQLKIMMKSDARQRKRMRFLTLSIFDFMDKEALKEETERENDESNWAHDQQKHDYYYDDSHGYEIYDPEEDECEEEELDSTE